MQHINRKILKYIHKFKKISALGLLVLSVLVIFIAFGTVIKYADVYGITPVTLSSLLFNEMGSLKRSENRTNIIILGISGGEHDGSDLTDTIIFLSIDFEKKDFVLVSVPRDLWLPSLKTKINSVYHFGEEKKEGGGIILAKSAVSEVLGESVNYAFLIDFSIFTKLIDMLGGVDVDVENSFTDELYPIAGREDDFCSGDPDFKCRFETVIFNKGMQHMDGETALKYVRSRNAQGEEGTDFSRGKRQQQVMSAIFDKVNKSINIANIGKFKQIYSYMLASVKTDMKLSEMLLLGKYIWRNFKGNTRQLILDTGNQQKNIRGFLENPPLWEFDGIWVLVPRTRNFTEIHEYISCQLKDKNCSIQP